MPNDDVTYGIHTTQELVDMLQHEYIDPGEPVIIRILSMGDRVTDDVTEFRVTPDAGGTIIELRLT